MLDNFTLLFKLSTLFWLNEDKTHSCIQTYHGFVTAEEKSWSFRGDRIQWNFLWQTAASGCEGFPTIRELTPSPSSGCVGGLVVQKLKSRCPTLRSAGREVEGWHSTSRPAEQGVGHLDTTKSPAHPEDGDGDCSRIVGKPSHPDAVVCRRKFH